ncbi:GntR family transcriptional regulator [Streptomyces sp. NPDC001978]|uniref:GntR family transcriptional regulator n=1 Tax=Streptomyces sp. NPDC001978 TaxID=3364627 RepID=UPI00368B02AB
MISLDRDAMTPMYVQLANVLRDRIRRGEIPIGRRLPSQSELEAETGGTVSRRTIKSAIEVLAAEGLVQGVQGKGVFVVALPAAPEQQ